MAVHDHTHAGKDMSVLAVAFCVFLCILFGANAIAVKVGLSGIGPFTTGAIRFSIASFVICLWARLSGRSLWREGQKIRHMVILGCIFTLQLSSLYLGMRLTFASRGTLIVNLQPFFVLLLSQFFIPEESITVRKVVGLIMGFTGVALIFIGDEGFGSGIRIGDYLILTNALCWACSAVYIKKIIWNYEPFQVTVYPMIFAVPLFFIGALLFDSPMIIDLNLKVLAALGFQTIISASFGFVAWNYMLQRYGAIILHSFLFIMPLTGVILSGVLLGEPLTLNILAALVCITVGIMIIHLRLGRTVVPPPMA